MNAKVKFCGLTCPEAIALVNRLLPDYVGFVLAPKSKRYVSPQTAHVLKMMLNPKIKAVGVFVNEEPQFVASLLERGSIDLAQLHGEEDTSYINELKSLTARPIIKAVIVKGISDVKGAFSCPADYLLYDGGRGEGQKFAWDCLKGVKRPYFLAGGLTPGNVGAAIKMLQPYAVDVSSGIETNGRKDEGKMVAFMESLNKLRAERSDKHG